MLIVVSYSNLMPFCTYTDTLELIITLPYTFVIYLMIENLCIKRLTSNVCT